MAGDKTTPNGDNTAAANPAAAGASNDAQTAATAAGKVKKEAKKERKYTVLQLLDDGKIMVIGEFPGGTRDDAVWTAVDKNSALKAESEGKTPPKLLALPETLAFEEFVLEPIPERKRVKRPATPGAAK